MTAASPRLSPPTPSDRGSTRRGARGRGAPDRGARGRRAADPLEPRGLVRVLRIPAAFLAANWAALLGMLTLVGIVPALAAATRVTSLLDEHADDAFTATLRHVRRTLRRDAPVSGLLLLVIAGMVLNGLLLPGMPAEARVLLVGVLTPVIGALIALLSAYVVVAAEQPGVDRPTVVLGTVQRVLRRPLAALLAPVLVVLLAPLWLLAPLTIACGMSVPPWLLGRLWGATPES